MRVGDEQYRKTLRRWHSLSLLTKPTTRQKNELARVEAALNEAELQAKGFGALTDDYDQLRQMGDLGGVEVL